MSDFTKVAREPETNWILYPRDMGVRRELYGEELAKEASVHPAKMNLFACQDIVDYVSKPGDTIVDPFGGIGTTMTAGCLTNRNVILLEIEEVYAKIAQAIYDRWVKDEVENLGNCVIIKQDNRQVLPLPCHHIITSPPYGNDLFTGSTGGSDKSTAKLSTGGNREEAEENAAEMAQYGANVLNIGRLNPFLYVQTMNRLYGKMVDSIMEGGTISITHRDRTKEGQRVLYAKSIIKTLNGLGMKLEVWEKWRVPKTLQANVNKAQGADVVEDEDILVFRKSYKIPTL